MAIAQALQGRQTEALRLLHDAVEHGLSPNDCLALEEDADLKSLHDDPRFREIVAEAHRRATGNQQTH